MLCCLRQRSAAGSPRPFSLSIQVKAAAALVGGLGWNLSKEILLPILGVLISLVSKRYSSCNLEKCLNQIEYGVEQIL